MKIIISEKQLEKLVKGTVNQEVSEQDDAAAAQPSAGTSSTQSGGEGYPEVGVWESGVTRGPANPIGNGKMEDRVKERGKANKLK